MTGGRCHSDKSSEVPTRNNLQQRENIRKCREKNIRKNIVFRGKMWYNFGDYKKELTSKMNERIIANSTAQHSTAQHSTAQHSLLF